MPSYLLVRAVALISLASSVALAQSPTAADQAFARADWPAAEREYTLLVQRDTSDVRSHFRLGVARFELGQFARAIPLFERAAAAGFQVNVAEFRMARAHARLGAVADALAHLERAVAAGVGLELVTGNPDLAPVRTESRYLALVLRLEQARFPCRYRAEAHQFDFWIGEWEVSVWDSTGAPTRRVGTSRITSQLEQCLVFEEWTPTSGAGGKSVNFWDTNRARWRQVWVDASGSSLDYEGAFVDGAMRFTGWTLGENGVRVLQRLTFLPVARDTVRQRFESSQDNGVTWTSAFDGRYVRVAR